MRRESYGGGGGWGEGRKCKAQGTKEKYFLGDDRRAFRWKGERHFTKTKVIFNDTDNKIVHQMIVLLASIYNCIQVV